MRDRPRLGQSAGFLGELPQIRVPSATTPTNNGLRHMTDSVPLAQVPVESKFGIVRVLAEHVGNCKSFGGHENRHHAGAIFMNHAFWRSEWQHGVSMVQISHNGRVGEERKRLCKGIQREKPGTRTLQENMPNQSVQQ